MDARSNPLTHGNMAIASPTSTNQPVKISAAVLQKFDVVKEEMSEAGWLFIAPSSDSKLSYEAIVRKGCWRRVSWLKCVWNWFWSLFKYPTTAEQCRALNTVVFKRVTKDLQEEPLELCYVITDIVLKAVGINRKYSLLIDCIKETPADDQGYLLFFRQPFELMVETLSSHGWYFVMPSQQPAYDIHELQTGKWVRVSWVKRLLNLFWAIFGFRTTAEECRVINKKAFSAIVLDHIKKNPMLLHEKLDANNQFMRTLCTTAIHVAVVLQQQQFLIHFNYSYVAISEFAAKRYESIMRGLIKRNSELIEQFNHIEAGPATNPTKKVKKYQTLPAPVKDDFSLVTARPFILKLRAELLKIEETVKNDIETVENNQDQDPQKEDKLRQYKMDQEEIDKLRGAFNTIATMLKPPPKPNFFPESPAPAMGSPFRNVFSSPLRNSPPAEDK